MNRLLILIGIALFCASRTAGGDTSVPSQARAQVQTRKPASVVQKATAPQAAKQLAQVIAPKTASRSPASYAPPSGAGGTKDISEELKIMGQSRNLSMGLLFQKDKDKLTFGTPRTNYEDKVSDKKVNF